MKRPAALTIVAWLFMASGVLAIVGVVIDLVGHHTISIDITILNWWIGRWLLDLRHRGYRWAVTILRVEFALLPIAVILLVVDAPLNVRVFGLGVGQASPLISLLLVTAMLLLGIWEYVVQRQAAARGLFTSEPL
jgi:hypothetical protein